MKTFEYRDLKKNTFDKWTRVQGHSYSSAAEYAAAKIDDENGRGPSEHMIQVRRVGSLEWKIFDISYAEQTIYDACEVQIGVEEIEAAYPKRRSL